MKYQGLDKLDNIIKALQTMENLTEDQITIVVDQLNLIYQQLELEINELSIYTHP